MNNNDYDLLERPLHPTSSHDDTAREFYKHSKGQRIATDAVIAQSIRRQYPELQLTIVPQTTCNLLAYAAAGFAQITPIEDPEDPLSAPLKWRQYIPPTRRLDGEIGVLVDQIQYGKYLYRWNNQDLIVYIVNGRDGVSSYPMIINQYILTSLPVHITDTLVLESSKWSIELHDEVWVFDAGYWQKSAELYRSVQSSRWEDVILDKEMKESIVHDVMNFYDSRETYAKLKVPWKRGVIYYGPPGNGKTISIKAMMHSLYNLKIPIPTLYVRSLVSVSLRSLT